MTYTIKSGKHRSGIHVKPHIFSKEFAFHFSLHRDCWFPKYDADDFAINKIYGVSFGYHHHNSVRLGWTPSEKSGEYDLYLYVYNNKERWNTYIGSFNCDRFIFASFNFDVENDKCELRFGEKEFYSVGFNFNYPKFKHGYILNPYFGGKKVSPWEMNIKIYR